MRYVIVYDDSTDYHSSRRFNARTTDAMLATKIRTIQARGHVIVSVRQDL